MNYPVVIALSAALLLSAGPTLAQPATAQERFAVTYEAISNTCGNKHAGVSLGRGSMTASISGDKLRIDSGEVPRMDGSIRRGGKFQAESQSIAKGGVSTRFSANGRIAAGALQLSLVVEFYRGSEPLCTQSWEVSGKR